MKCIGISNNNDDYDDGDDDDDNDDYEIKIVNETLD